MPPNELTSIRSSGATPSVIGAEYLSKRPLRGDLRSLTPKERRCRRLRFRINQRKQVSPKELAQTAIAAREKTKPGPSRPPVSTS